MTHATSIRINYGGLAVKKVEGYFPAYWFTDFCEAIRRGDDIDNTALYRGIQAGRVVYRRPHHLKLEVIGRPYHRDLFNPGRWPLTSEEELFVKWINYLMREKFKSTKLTERSGGRPL